MSTAKMSPFELVGADGGPLRGQVWTSGSGKGRPAVVLCHGWKGFMGWGFLPYLAERLARAGFTAVSFSFSGSGVGPDGSGFTEPDRFARGTFSNDLVDVEIVGRALLDGTLVNALKAVDHYGLFGFSRGGGTAVLHAAADPAVWALVTWAAIAHAFRWDEDAVRKWRLDGKREIPDAWTGEKLVMFTDMLDDVESNSDQLNILRAAERLQKPWLIVHGGADEFIDVCEARELHQVGGRSGTELFILPNASHTLGTSHPWRGSNNDLDSAIGRTVAWFSKHLF